MKILFRIVLVLTVLPPVLCALGFLLAQVFECAGSFRIETCNPPIAYSYISPLLVMGWISIFTVPAGLAILVLIAIVRARLRRRAAS